MFERYTEKARRAIFFARYEASQNGSLEINSIHLLLGILHEGKALFSEEGLQVSLSDLIEDCRKALPPPQPVIPTNIDLPLSGECRQALTDASDQADRLGSEHIGWQHLMMGLIKASADVAQVLQRHGITLESLAAITPAKEAPSGAAASGPMGAAAVSFVEFFCQGERIASVPGMAALPREGDELVFGSPKEPRTYKVLAVRFQFEENPATKSSGHQWLTKVVVETERLQG
ncbi:MAG TPA: Clp protease N-terminal domain-containing protein [Terriglobales bacterium]|nr:Clp protease N-terminal domain-containing protein [Terriglobales bacterium]